MTKKYKMKKAEEIRFNIPLLTAGQFTQINASDYVKIDDEESFGEVLSRYYKELRKIGLTIEKLSELTGLRSSTISLYLTGERNPRLYSLIALCIGMRLYYPRSLLLMKKARVTLDEDALKDRICMKYLIGCGFDASLTVDSCNREHGLRELVNIKDSFR